MSASKQKRVRQENREETIQKIAEEKAAEKRKKKLKKVRNIVIAVVVVLVIAAVIVINSNLFYTGIPAITINGTEFTIEHNSLPTQYLVEGVVLMIVGFMLVYVLEKISAKKS